MVIEATLHLNGDDFYIVISNLEEMSGYDSGFFTYFDGVLYIISKNFETHFGHILEMELLNFKELTISDKKIIKRIMIGIFNIDFKCEQTETQIKLVPIKRESYSYVELKNQLLTIVKNEENLKLEDLKYEGGLYCRLSESKNPFTKYFLECLK